MYRLDIWRFTNSIEREYKYMGNYGAKGEKRAPRKKPTKEQIKKQNQRNKEKYIRKLIKANFHGGDLWCTFKYAKGQRPDIEEVNRDIKKFKSNMRDNYKKAGQPFKFIQRIEIGKQGGIHIHMIMNRITGDMDTYSLITKYWNPQRPTGGANITPLREETGFKKLANYIAKEPDEEQYKQLSLFDIKERKQMIKYSSSRNLVRPEPETKEYTRRTVRKIIENGIEPTPGFYIDKDSVDIGINPFTGMSYIHYTELRTNPIYHEPVRVEIGKGERRHTGRRKRNIKGKKQKTPATKKT